MDKISQPLVSIIMPVYNCKRFVRQAIESILNQTYTHFEFLIADDGSTDGTKRILDSYKDPRIKRFDCTKNQGYLKTWNSLIAKSSGDFITFQDADDFSHPKRLETLLNQIATQEDIHAIGSNYIRIDEKGIELERSNFELNRNFIKQSIPNKFEFIGSGIIIKREVYDELGGYHLTFDRIGAEDLHWIGRIIYYFNFENIPDSLYYYRLNGSSLSGNLSDNYNKLNSLQIVRFLLNNLYSNQEDINDKNSKELVEFKSRLSEPYIQDKSLFNYQLALRYWNEKKKLKAIKHLCKSVIQKPTLKKIRETLYILRTKK